MDPIIGALISGGASMFGSVMNANTSAANTQANIQAQEQMQQQTEQFNAGQAQIARDYTTQMSNTAYQRASADMQKAGLNPMMMFGSGGPASTPSSPSPAVGSPNMALSQKMSPFAGIGDAVSKAINSAVEMKSLDRMTQEIANMRTQQALTSATIRTEAQRPEDVAAAATLKQNEAKRVAASLPVSVWEGKQASDLLGMPDAVRKTGSYVSYGADKISDLLAPFVSGAGALQRYRSGALMDKINKGNFIGRYGTPVDEYLAQ